MIARRPFRSGVSLILISTGLSLLGLNACSSAKVADLEPIRPLPSDVPQDLQAKFEVKEISAEPSQPAPSPSPSGSVAGKGKGRTPKKGAVKSNAAAAPAKSSFQFPSRRPAKDPLWVGERMVLEVTFFGVVAGDMVLDVLPFKEVNGRKVYHLKGSAKNSSMFKLFYTLDDSIESYYDYEGLFSHRFHMLLNQSRQKRDSVELYDSEKKQVYFWSRKNHVEKGFTEVKEYKDIPAFPQDSFSALYFARTLPLEVGKQYSIPVVSEGKAWEAMLTVVRKEMLETPMGKISTIVVKPETRFQGVLKKRGDSFIWLTDDDRRLVVRLEANVKIGTVIARLKSYEKGTPPTEKSAPAKPTTEGE